ncbi:MULTISPECIES: helix-turn-helix domain-containing protein [Streptomyces]|uniref:helix-turn-helix domain-containing protein n=1 Tax=Streptomyces TaxID=1883 RepID=UPI0016771873|nr:MULTISPECIES: AraC family transcriptional regulator [Streptomyces]MBD3578098.1 helix-turn-helix transcriptional regulator [Streptomyces sp. KD18]GGT02092.1 putative AraC-family regulatory protein [Streptomyces toxytricini]
MPVNGETRADGRGVRMTRMGGRWRVTRPWPAHLRPFLHSYAGYWEAAATPYRVRLVPTGRAVVLINLGEPFAQVRRLADGTGLTGQATGALVVGLEDGPRVCDHPGGQEAIRLELTPLGAYRLFALPMGELTNRAVGLGDVLGPAARLLVDRMAATPSWTTRFDLLDAALTARLDSGPVPAPEVVQAWRLLRDSGGTVPIGRIAADVGWSQGHLVRRFTQQVGLTPKASARVLRFQRAVRLLTGEHATPADVTAACGYYDQAHLNREFRALADTTPGRLAAARLAEGALTL